MEHLPYFYLMVSQPGGCSTESQLLLCGFVPALCVGGCAIAHMAWSCVCPFMLWREWVQARGLCMEIWVHFPSVPLTVGKLLNIPMV